MTQSRHIPLISVDFCVTTMLQCIVEQGEGVVSMHGLFDILGHI